MLRFILFLFLSQLHFFGTAQSVISSSGDYFLGSQGSLSWTIGESITETLETGNGILTQGFQQYYDDFLSTPEIILEGALAIFPNPFENELMLQTTGFGTEYRIVIFDTQLKEIRSLNVSLPNGMETYSMNLSDLSAGAYFLTIESKTLHLSATRQIIKLNEKN